MKYTFQVYRASLGDALKGYVYARSKDEAISAWNELKGLNAYYEIHDESMLKTQYHADHFDCMDDAEFYEATPEEGGFVIMLAPDELSDRIIEASHTRESHVFYLVGLDDE